LASKPESLADDDFINSLYRDIANDTSERSTIRIVQFTDLHIDLNYKVGSNSVCDDVLCCREENGMATDPTLAAGVYGSVSFCDVPISVLDKMTEKVNELAPDTLFWTGDVAPHDQWNYSQEYVENYQTFLFNYM
jgi:sphingomyelin phosphodiesterase